MCIVFVYTLLKVVNYYDLSVLLSVMCFQKKLGWVGGTQFYFGFFEFVYFAKPLMCLTVCVLDFICSPGAWTIDEGL